MALENTAQKTIDKKNKQRFGLGKKPQQKNSPKFYKNSPQKTTTSQPAKVHTSARLATQPRSASPLPACDHLEQSARVPIKPATAPPAPQT